MSSVNKVILVGSVGKDPEVRYMPDGGCVANISLATNSSWKDKNTGERREDTEWHRVVVYGKLAEIAGEYVKKSRLVYVEGRLKTRKWQDQSGADRYTTEIIADSLQLLGSNGSKSADQSSDDGNEGQSSNGGAQSASGRQAPANQNQNGGRAQAPSSRAQNKPNEQRQPAMAGGGIDSDDIPFAAVKHWEV